MNNPGSWGHIFAPLRHAEWSGCTPTDLVFPFFLFIVGMASFFSFRKFDFALTPQSFFKVLKRSVLIFVIGFGLNAFPFLPKSVVSWGVDYESIRIFGVLQRIALAYFLGASICLLLKKTKYLIGAGAILMLAFWAILYVAYPAAPYHKQNNACRDVDMAIPGENHVYRGNWGIVSIDDIKITPVAPAAIEVTAKPGADIDICKVRLSNTDDFYLERDTQAGGLRYTVTPKEEAASVKILSMDVLPQITRARLIGPDPEGLLGVISAAATVIFGFLVGRLINRRNKDGKENVVLYLFLYGLPAIFIGMFWGQWFPINKPLWTGSYVLYTGGLAMVILAFFIWLMDVKAKERLFKPFVAFGSNPLFLFVLAGVIAKILSRIKIEGVGAYSWLYANIYSPAFGDKLGSLLQALTLVFVMWAIAQVLYQRKIYIKV